MRILLITMLLLLPISAAAAAELPPRVGLPAVSDAALEKCAHQRTPWFFPTPADLAFAREYCLREGPPRRLPYFDLPW
jgi:hypothetical protein